MPIDVRPSPPETFHFLPLLPEKNLKKKIITRDIICVYDRAFTFYPIISFIAISEATELTGGTNLMQHYGLEHSYLKFSSKKLKDELSTFLPNLPGHIDTPGIQDNRQIFLSFFLIDYC